MPPPRGLRHNNVLQQQLLGTGHGILDIDGSVTIRRHPNLWCASGRKVQFIVGAVLERSELVARRFGESKVQFIKARRAGFSPYQRIFEAHDSARKIGCG